MKKSSRYLPAWLAAAAVVAASATAALAQYDRDGRYVPSPMGVPADPYARPVPMYPGTPGGAVGTPALPRSAYPEPPKAPPSPPRVTTEPLRPTFVPLTLDQCQGGWTQKLHVTPTEFRRRCSLLLKKEEHERQKQQQEKADEGSVKRSGRPGKEPGL